MAAAVLVGVNRSTGCTRAWSVRSRAVWLSTRRMVVTTTTAAALAAGSTMGAFSNADRSEALFVLTVLAGAMMISAGLLRLGRYTRFVSESVMTGFLSGVAANIVLGQLRNCSARRRR